MFVLYVYYFYFLVSLSLSLFSSLSLFITIKILNKSYDKYNDILDWPQVAEALWIELISC